MNTKKLFNYIAAALVCCGISAAFTACSSDDDPFFTADENDAPRILNTDIPEGKGGVAGVLMNIERTTNFKYEVLVTPVHYTTVNWYLDNVLIYTGNNIDMPLLAGEHDLRIEAVTTKGLSTSRTAKLIVRPLDSDPALGNTDEERWLTTGTTKTLYCTNTSSVTKVFIGTEEATNVSYKEGELTFDVPAMDKGEYMVSIEDASGMRYGCGWFTVSEDEYVNPSIQETVLWEGGTDINWGDSNVKISTEEMAAVPVGTTIRVYYEMVDMKEGYHALRITTPKWGDNPEDQVVAQFDLTGETPNPFEFTYTEANKAIVDERGGMLIVGYGYKVTKVTFMEVVASAETEIWKGSTEINWGDSNVNISTEDMAAVPVGAKVNLYYEMVDMKEGYHALRITTPKWGDNPEDQVVAQFDITDETPNPFSFTYTEANKAIVDERGGMLIVGYGYKVTRITFE